MSERYRIEDGRACIDLHVRTSRQLFDGRDPAPFRERDLDEDAVESILGAAQELGARHPLRLVVHLSDETASADREADVRAAVRAHFEYMRRQLTRRLREHLRQARVFLAAGVVVLAVFLALAQWAGSWPESTLREIVREGLFITGWVAMWRPLEALLYDWWPIVTQRRRIDRILAADVHVRYPNATPSEDR
jgi:hypothetical protein